MSTRLILLFYLFLFLQFNVYSQKEDFVWYTGKSELGYCCAHFFSFNDTGYVKELVTIDYPYKIRASSGKSIMADEDGNLLFYTDGFDVFNREHRIMKNGERTFVMSGELLANAYNNSGGVNIPDWTIILPSPVGNDEYFLFYLGMTDDEVSRSQVRGTGLNYSIIDISLDDGLGEVVEKNINLIEMRSIPRSLKGIRHANGRDWWIMVREMLNDRWHVFLLDNKGVNFYHVSEAIEIPEYYCRLVIYNYVTDQYICMTGSHFYPWKFYHDRPFDYQFHVYDFDRCIGTFNFSHTFELETWSHKYSLKSLTLCPKGRYLYGGLGGRYLIQYDTWVENVQASADTLLNIFTMENAVPGIYEPKLTPRGEMWLQHWAKDSITVILNPELGGTDFNVSDEFITTPWVNTGTFPNNANYRIGPIDGSPCDTLGIDNLPKAWFRYNGMNLTHLERRFTDASYFRPEHWEWDFGDGTSYIGREPGVHEFPDPGDYYVCLTVSNENAEDTYCEWVTIEGPSNLSEQLEEKGFVLFPNPNRGHFHLHFTSDLRERGELRMYNMLGQQVYHQDLPIGAHQLSLDATHSPSGQYIVRIRADGEVYSQGVVLME
ncbi:MAG: T9SS C-terminal target domain-containing protein [Saprospirales bacterium]|nr:MAG: T9SS C-terminal target domain-containing protein [Saprospirales bacterium]